MLDDTVILGGRELSIDDVARVARNDAKVRISNDARIRQRTRDSHNYVMRLVQAGERIYGVTTGFGGMSNIVIPPDNARQLQQSLLWFLKAGAGPRLPQADVRASMVLRANSLLRGVSGIRMELLHRFEVFLNANVTPHVRELGSIGASGDLVPLAAIAGSLIGLDDSFRVDLNGREMGAVEALRRIGLQPATLEPKEGLALVNGSSVMAGIATNCVYDARILLSLALGAHALMFQGMRGNTHVLHPFIHRHKPHPGQVWVARNLFKLLKGSRWTRGERHGGFAHSGGGLAQDRYSLRCLPQYMGPIVDGLAVIARQVEIEANSATDNPLFDGECEACYEGGNFLGQYIGVGMDQLRFYLGLMAKQLDAQIGVLVAPEFNNGLPASLVGNGASPVNMGLKGLQLTGNSIVPELLHLGAPLVDRFQTHAEQFNQNVNSLGFGAANLARRSIALSQQYLSIALMFGVQAADLRAFQEEGHYDGRAGLSPATVRLYDAVYHVCRRQPGQSRAFVHDDHDQSLENDIESLAADIASDGRVCTAIQGTLQDLKQPSASFDPGHKDDQIMNVAQNIIRGRRLFPNKNALICGDRRYTYAELDDWSSIIANGLARLGVARGQRVALFLPNIPEFVAAYLGIQKRGAVAVSLNTSLRAEETTFILQDSGAVAVFTTEQLRSSVDKQAATSVEHVIIAEGAAGGEDTSLSELTAGASPEILAEVMDRDDPSAILYTSGTTGEPKGACLSHGNVISNMHSFNHNCGVRPDDRLLLFLPLFHCFGQNAILNNGLNACATLVMHREFHPATIVRSIIEDQVTMFFGVPTTFIPIYKEAAASDLSSVRYYFSAAAPLPREIARKWQEKYQRVINEGYGLTETSPFASYNHLHWYKIGSIGAPIENVEMRVVDVETGVEVPTGESGEIVIRGPNVMLGYWNRPEATEKAIRNGWFHTGDIGRVDQDGYFYIVDRLKDMINVGGLKVYPIEVENAIYQHPAVEDVAVYGVSDPLMGERSCANIVRKAGHEADEAEIRAFCRQQLADYKIPSDIRFVDSIPKSPTGKILKRVLRIQERKPAAVPVRPVVAREIEEWIRYWLAENLQIEGDAVAAETTFFDLGMTSLLGLKLSQQLGAWLGVALEDVVVWNHGALGSLVNHAAQLVEAAVVAPSDQTGGLEKAAASPAAALKAEPPPDHGYSLSHGQEALWFLWQVAPESWTYNMVLPVRIRGGLDVQAFRRSLQQMSDRHACLRTKFFEDGGKPLQHALPHHEVVLEQIDAASWSDAQIDSAVVAEAQRPFDLETSALPRFTLFRCGPESHVLLIVVHHIVSDLWSFIVLMDELRELYQAEAAGVASRLPELPVTYEDYVRWQRQILQASHGERLWSYWRGELSGELPVLDLPTDYSRPPAQSFRGGTVFQRLDAGLTSRLKELARRECVTLYTVLLAAYQVLLHRYTGQDDIVVGTPAAGRPRDELAGLVGDFVNMLPLRLQLAGGPSFRQVLTQARGKVVAAIEHQDFPFSLMVDRLQLTRDLSRSPIFQTTFVLQTFHRYKELSRVMLPSEDESAVPFGDLALEPLLLAQQDGQFDLNLEMKEDDEGRLVGAWKYAADLFDASTITRISQHFATLLGEIAADPERPVAKLPLLTGAERRAAIARGCGPAIELPPESSVCELFERQAQRRGAAIAVRDARESLTYSELRERVARLAEQLVVLGVRRGGLVAVLHPRGVEFVTALLAISKAGAAFLPLDPRHPLSRIAQILETSGALLVLTTAQLAEDARQAVAALTESNRPRVMDFGELSRAAASASLPAIHGDDLAYVMFTSGSTGSPKGAMVEHRGMVNHVLAKLSDLEMDEHSVLAQNGPQSFDIVVWQCLAPLVVGGRVEVFEDDVAEDPARLLKEVQRRGVTVLQLVPTMLHAVLEEAAAAAGGAPQLTTLRWLVPTGDALPTALCRRWLQLYPGIPVLNTYGSTECSDDQCHYAIRKLAPADDAAPVISIGTPIPNMTAYVLDANLAPVPVGVVGELYIGGLGVGRGYCNDPQRTDAAFLPDPFSSQPGARLYRTRDLVRSRANGSLDFLARADHMVKLRGFRIEPGEIETALTQQAGIAEAAVVAREDPSGERRLVAYVVCSPQTAGTPSDGKLVADQCRQHLAGRLPQYMIPTSYCLLDALPLTANGKLDVRRLPPPQWQAEGAEQLVDPGTETERLMAGIWAEVLGVEWVGVTQNFFAIGGDSIRSIQIVTRCKRAGLSLRPGDLFQHPTIATLAALVDRNRQHAEGGGEPTSVVLAPRVSDEQLELALGQVEFEDE